MSDINYGFLDRVLHRLALNYGSIAEMSFDFDQSIFKSFSEDVRGRPHVFVSGLARSGTTVLMRRFYESGRYRSLTYRDMPFVLAPNLWKRVAPSHGARMADIERSHGDGIMVNFDSPESFEEVFWRVFAGPQYLRRDRLLSHSPGPETRNKFLSYICAVLLSATSGAHLYLSKNNNSILRLGTISEVFPNAVSLVPFRDPLQHANSLLTQHKRFSALQESNPFTLSYMTWLGHHEFGLDHRPFKFSDDVSFEQDRNSLEYWLQLWSHVYGHIENVKPESAVFVCYEDLCQREQAWSRIAEIAGMPILPGRPHPFVDRRKAVNEEASAQALENAREIYTRLKERSLSVLS